jgi:ribonuclease HI
VPWRKAQFKGSEVLARCDEHGEFRADGGRVEIRYRAQDGRAYHASMRNLAPVRGGEIMPDDACAPAVAPDTARGRGKPGASSIGSSSAPRAPEKDALVAYADGACSGNPGPAGVGVVLIDGKSRRELSHYLGEGTNNIAELTAIELVAKEIGPTDRPVRIYTDSQYAIGVLSKGWKAKANVELVARVRAVLKQFKDVELHYVRGHSGVPLNERADMLAVDAVQQRASSGWVKIA